MADVRIASTDTLLGLLQRGRGRGYLDALAADRGKAASASLVECITNDPRTDKQVESRDEFYGRCAFEIGLDLAPLEPFLFGPEDQEHQDEFRTGLAIGVLGWLGHAGRNDAIALLRRYVKSGWNWEWAIQELASPRPIGLEGLDTVVVSRAESLDTLARAMWPGAEPWENWRKTNPQVREAFELRESWNQEREKTQRGLPALTTEELLARREVRALRGRTSPSDKAILLAAARGGPDEIRRDALKALGYQRDPAVLEPAEAELRRFQGADWPPNAGWFAIAQLLKAGPLERVRSWIGEDGLTGRVALHMISAWPKPDDAPLLRGVLDHVGDDEWLYQVCDAVDALARLSDMGAASLLERVFKNTTYSYLRHRAARALAIVSDRFADDLAVECLWDCEESTRAVGCATATWTSPRVRQRIAEIASDRLEARSPRAVAMRRQRAIRIP